MKCVSKTSRLIKPLKISNTQERDIVTGECECKRDIIRWQDDTDYIDESVQVFDNGTILWGKLLFQPLRFVKTN
jgi:hypothetical protein